MRDRSRTFVLPAARRFAASPLDGAVGRPRRTETEIREPSLAQREPDVKRRCRLAVSRRSPLQDRTGLPQVAVSPLFASKNRPVRNSMLPPDRALLSWKFMTPAIASEPYCATPRHGAPRPAVARSRG